MVLEISLLGGVVTYQPAAIGAQFDRQGQPAESAADDRRVASQDPTPAAEPVHPREPASMAADTLADVAVPQITVQIAGASVVYFGVFGGSSQTLLESAREQAAAYCGAIAYQWYAGDPRPVGCAHYAVGYRSQTAAGTCRITGFWLDQTVYFPQWASPGQVPSPLLRWWRDWLSVTASHEAGHVAIAQEWLPKIEAQGLGVDCAGVDATLANVMQQLAVAQEAYDRHRYSTDVYPAAPN